jgi:hypothetical protein
MPVNRRGFRRGLTSSEASLPFIGKPVGETRRGQIVDLEGKPPRGQRVLDARSGVRAGDREYKESSNPESISIKNSFKQNGAVILLDIELPLSLRLRAASCRLEVYFKFSRDASTPTISIGIPRTQPATCSLSSPPALRLVADRFVSLLFSKRSRPEHRA